MHWKAINKEQQIIDIIHHLISQKTEIKVSIQGEKTAFTSKIIKINHGDICSKIGKRPELIMEKLVPEKGNTLMKSFPEFVMEFFIDENLFRGSMKYIGISDTYPYLGIIVNLPKAVEVEEKRKEERFAYEMPNFVSAEFALKGGPIEDKVYNLKVLDGSVHGIKLLVTQKDFELLDVLDNGVRLNDISFFAAWAMIKVDGTVRHKTKIEEGKHKGCYVLGIESDEIIKSCKPKKI